MAVPRRSVGAGAADPRVCAARPRWQRRNARLSVVTLLRCLSQHVGIEEEEAACLPLQQRRLASQ